MSAFVFQTALVNLALTTVHCLLRWNSGSAKLNGRFPVTSLQPGLHLVHTGESKFTHASPVPHLHPSQMFNMEYLAFPSAAVFIIRNTLLFFQLCSGFFSIPFLRKKPEPVRKVCFIRILLLKTSWDLILAWSCGSVFIHRLFVTYIYQMVHLKVQLFCTSGHRWLSSHSRHDKHLCIGMHRDAQKWRCKGKRRTRTRSELRTRSMLSRPQTSK